MSHPLFMALFTGSDLAAAAAQDLHAAGIGREDLSIVAGNHSREESLGRQIDGTPGSEIEDSPAASRLGELGGYVLAAIAIGMPGTGALVAAGPLAAEFGEAAGHVAGDLEATLVSAGLSESEAGEWHGRIESGRAILLGVHVRAANGAEVEAILARHSGGRVIHTEWEEG